jgi:hypothetical protein
VSKDLKLAEFGELPVPKKLGWYRRKRFVINVYESPDRKYYLRLILKPGIRKTLETVTVDDIDYVLKKLPKRYQASYVRSVIVPDREGRNRLLFGYMRALFGLYGGVSFFRELSRRRIPPILRRTAQIVLDYMRTTREMYYRTFNDYSRTIKLENFIAKFKRTRRRKKLLPLKHLRSLLSEPLQLDDPQIFEKLEDLFFVGKVLQVPIQALSGYPVLLVLHQDGEGYTLIAPHARVYPTDVDGLIVALSSHLRSSLLMRALRDQLERIRLTVKSMHNDGRVYEPMVPASYIRHYFRVAREPLPKRNDEPRYNFPVSLDPRRLARLLKAIDPKLFPDNRLVVEGQYDAEANVEEWKPR